ncbi:MAG: 3TM-type holin [Deltaproteobacteria bacterium]
MDVLSWVTGRTVKDASESVKGVLDGVGSLAISLRSAVTGDIPAEKKAELEAKILEIEASLTLAQVKVNEIEAQSTSLFIAGWRPAAGWLGVGGLACASIGRPFLAWISLNFGWSAPPEIDTGVLITLLLGLLGLGGLRTFEKVKDAENNR